MDWIRNEIALGFQRLICLCLDRQPTDDLIAGTMEAWYEAWTYRKIWHQERDAPRFREAFVRFSTTQANCWPQPMDIIALLPDPPPPAPYIGTPVDSERSRARMAEIAERLKA